MASKNILFYWIFLAFSSLFLHALGQSGWSERQPMPTPRSDVSAITVGNMIVVAGGCDGIQACPIGGSACSCTHITATVEAYLPDTDKWITLPDMPFPRFRQKAVLIGTLIWFIGGRDINDNLIQTVTVFDTVAKTWRISNANWTSAASDGVAVGVGTNILAIGGYTFDYNSLSSVWVLDTVLELWTPGGIEFPPIIQDRGDACAGVVNNEIFVVGGYSSVNFCAPLNSLEIFDLSNYTWSSGASLHYPRGSLACDVLHGEFHAIGGEQKSNVTNCSKYNVPIHTVEHYHEPTNSWADETSLPTDRYRFAAATYGNTFYIFGGQGALNVTGQYYPIIGKVEAWVDPTQENTGRAFAFSFSVISLAFMTLLF